MKDEGISFLQDVEMGMAKNSRQRKEGEEKVKSRVALEELEQKLNKI